MINEQTAASRTTISNGTGAYSVQELSIGTYTVTVTAQGFDTEKLSGFQIQADRTAALGNFVTCPIELFLPKW
jgi:hypothetical protein